MADITTKAGQALFTDMEPMDMWESNGVTPEDIAAIEQEAYRSEEVHLIAIAEAVRAERARLAAAVRGLDVPTWAGQQFVYRIDVLALLEGEA